MPRGACAAGAPTAGGRGAGPAATAAVERDAVSRLRYTLGFVALLTLLALLLVGLPFAFVNVVHDVRRPSSAFVFPLTPRDATPAAAYSRLNVDVTALDEVNRLVTLRVNGYHYCTRDCDYQDNVVFFSANADSPQTGAVPPSQAVGLPATSAEVDARITLPLTGEVYDFPFDRYRLILAVAVERQLADKTTRMLTPAETRGQLLVTMEEQVPRMDLQSLTPLDPRTVASPKQTFGFAAVAALDLTRPWSVKLVAVFVTMFTAAVGAWAAITRPFDQLIMSAGTLILGVWGARTLVLGGFPPDVTLIDTLLTGIVLFMLATILYRGMAYFHHQAELHLLPWERRKEVAKKTRECPECLSKIPLQATRCAFCTASVPPS
jgi:large conductance mechanosensitive channel